MDSEEEALLTTNNDDIPIDNSLFPKIYENLIEKRRPLKKPMPLTWVIRILWSEWQKEDWFPAN
jgi:hypothetical protein